MRITRDWTSDETNILINMRLNNEKLTYIAYKLKRSYPSIASKLKYIDCQKHYKKWTAEEWNQALKMQEEGFSYREIGQALNRKQSTVKGKFQTMRKRGVI